jgi:heat shock protein HtpX
MQGKLALTMSLTIVLIFGFLFALLAIIGYLFDLSGTVIIALAVGIALLQWLIGPAIIKMTTNMRPIGSEYEWLRDVTERICKKNDVHVPEIYIVNDGSPNAFTFGRTNSSATLAVTNGLLRSLTKDEVAAVVAHEIGHIKHWDMAVMTAVSVVPTLAYYVYMFSFRSRSSDRDRRSEAALVGIGAFIIYFVSNLLVLALSRLREYYADRFSGSVTKPGLLISGLAKITYGLGTRSSESQSPARAFMIADPVVAAVELSELSEQYDDLEVSGSELRKAMEWERNNPFARLSEIFRTHPLTWKRIQALREQEKEKGG